MRNRYFDLLRGVAMLRVIAYHVTSWGALTVFMPAMGLMFALGGSLMAASLDKRGTSAVGSRMRRMLPPLWVVGIASVIAFLISGVQIGWDVVWWFLPLQDPPKTGWVAQVFGVVWYLREYLWFVLLSPVALVAFRRRPIATLAVPYTLLVVFQLDLIPHEAVSWDFALYFGSWLLGFAHHDGVLTRMPRQLLLAIVSMLAGTAMILFAVDPPWRMFDLHDARLVDGLWQAAFLLLVLGLAPASMDWLKRRPWLDHAVTLLNRRAITIYLWHQVVHFALIAAVAALGYNWAQLTWLGQYTLVVVATALPVLAFGWVEDLASRRPVELWPGRRRSTVPTPVTPAAVGVETTVGAETADGRSKADAAQPDADREAPVAAQRDVELLEAELLEAELLDADLGDADVAYPAAAGRRATADRVA